jgi:hypothetical protein
LAYGRRIQRPVRNRGEGLLRPLLIYEVIHEDR